MPPNPNRQLVAQLQGLVSPADVEGIVAEPPKQSAFPPLTAQAPQQEQEEYVSNPNANPSYWDWPEQQHEETKNEKQTVMDAIVKEEEIRQTLSVTRMEQNLRKQASRQEHEDQVVSNVDSDDYWNMPSETDAVEDKVVVAQHVMDASHPKNSYWDWPSPTKQSEKANMIRNIVASEHARQATSVARIQANLVKQKFQESSCPQQNHDTYWHWESHNVPVEAPHVHDETHPRHTYWDWESEDGKQTLDRIVCQEGIRQFLASDRVVQTEKDAAKQVKAAPVVMAVRTGTPSSSYWDW